MIIAVKILALLFAVLHIAAAASKLRDREGLDLAAMMAAGAAVVAASVAMTSFAWLPALLGGAVVCCSAVLNGKRRGKVNLPHHLIRGTVVVLITVGYLIWG